MEGIACVVPVILTGVCVQTDVVFTPETSYLNNQATDIFEIPLLNLNNYDRCFLKNEH